MQKPSYKFLIALIYTVALFLDRLDLTIINITLPTVAKSFNVPITATDWINLSFLLALAIAIPISHWCGQRFGVKKIFTLALILFGLGSTLCAFANSLPTLVLLRFIHGIGGGMLIPVGMTMIYQAYDKSEYASITSFTFLPSLSAPAIAPFLGGLILDHLGWRFVFLFSGPICLALALLAVFIIREKPEQATQPLDWRGFILSSAILINVFYLFSLISYAKISFLLIIATACLFPLLALFIHAEKRAPFPLIDLKFFQNKTFVKANLLQLCFQTCHFGAIFIVGVFLQIGLGLSATLAGLIMGMQAIGAMFTSRFSVRLFNQYGAKPPIAIGLSGVAILSAFIILLKSTLIIVALLLFFCRGIFSGLCGTPIQTLSVIGFEKNEIGSINTIFSACRQVAISFGVALSSILLNWGFYLTGLNPASYVIPADKVITVFSLGFAAITGFAIVGLLVLRRFPAD